MNILFYGGHYWDKGAWFRKQQFASRLSKRGHKVFYVEGSISMLRKKANDKNKYYKTEIKQVDENLAIITPSALFPFPKNYLSRKIFNYKLFLDINNIFKQRNIDDYIFWFNKIDLSMILPKIKHPKIFDLCDDIPFYYKLAGDEKQYDDSLKYLKNSFKLSNYQIVSAVKLKEKYQQYSENEIIVVPNGHNININQSIPVGSTKIIKDIKKPIIGFIGTLFRFIDDNLLEYIISKRPDYNFVFVGDVENNFPIQKIKHFDNVFLISKQSKDLIPSIINSFDICINPFKVHEVNDSVNPVKVFEYLAIKKHIISTKMYSLLQEKISQYIDFANDYADFLNKIDKYVVNMKFVNDVPDDILNYYHWDNLFNNLVYELKEKYKILL